MTRHGGRCAICISATSGITGTRRSGTATISRRWLKGCLRSTGYPNRTASQSMSTPDAPRWYAERQTITGHWFAIGAAGPPTDQWLYDGPTKPSCFPNDAEWDQWVPDECSKELGLESAVNITYS